MTPEPPPPRLQPPPRVTPQEPRGGPRARGDRRADARRTLGSAAVVAVLGAALAGVFLWLPGWTAKQTSDAGAETTPVASGADAERVLAPPDAEPSPSPAPTPAVAATRPAPAAAARTGGASAPASTPAADRDFMDAMSRGLAALDREEWSEARIAFEDASRRRPDAPAVRDGLARVAAAERRAAVADAIRRGAELETAERWSEAERSYVEALALDPQAADALAGRDRAAARAELDGRLVHHLANTDRLASEAVFDDAAGTLEAARGTFPRGPRLDEQTARLEAALEIASTLLPVVLVSDSLTEVTVYRVGSLGRFARRELELRPGAYTAVGSRDGYRDVRVRFVVEPGTAPASVTVRCTEAL
jgi:hypothetical protein